MNNASKVIEGTPMDDGYQVEFRFDHRPGTISVWAEPEPEDWWPRPFIIKGIMSATVRFPFSFDVRETEYRFFAEVITPTRVVNIRNEPADVYIGRGSPWGNPFTHLYTFSKPFGTPGAIIVGSREEAIERYEEWLKGQPNLMAQLPELRGRTLGCYCHPLACHGDVLVRLADGEETTAA